MNKTLLLLAALVLILPAGVVHAVTYSGQDAPTNPKVKGTATVPDTVAADTDFDIVLGGERPDGGVSQFWLYRDPTYTVDSTGKVTVTTGTLLTSSTFNFSNPWTRTVTENLPAGTYTYLYVFAAAFAHNGGRAHLEFDVTVGKSVIPVAIDIKPQSCPNPLNVGSGGVVSVAILGSADFDAAGVDPKTVKLNGVAALRWNTEDVASPVANRTSPCQCTTTCADGYTDLVLKFDKRALIAAVGDVEDGDEITLTLEGALQDGGAIEGSDCMIVRKKGQE